MKDWAEPNKGRIPIRYRLALETTFTYFNLKPRSDYAPPVADGIARTFSQKKMQFDEAKVIEALNAEWRWILPPINGVVAVNSMGNVMLRDEAQCHWRVCPEELSAQIFARTPDELQAAYADPERKADWQMSPLVSELVEKFGEPEVGECFGFVFPAVLGGEYSVSNIRRRDLYEYLRYTGDVANQTKDLKDGETVKFEIV